MTPRDWFGFRTVTPGSKIWHGFKREGGRSLCGRVRFGPAIGGYGAPRGGRSCRRCAAAWKRKYPPRDTGTTKLFGQAVGLTA